MTHQVVTHPIPPFFSSKTLPTSQQASDWLAEFNSWANVSGSTTDAKKLSALAYAFRDSPHKEWFAAIKTTTYEAWTTEFKEYFVRPTTAHAKRE